ncbi:hypothetical protein AB4Z09_28900 [Rhodococcus sp. TAF43]|nr:hypothetical protein [Rhodococcus sp. W8901]QKT10432.1 hypothetical protein HUN07_06605 [Rhodococcus sp. W8901]
MNRARSVSSTTDKTTLRDIAAVVAILTTGYFATIEALRIGLWLIGGAA